MKNLPGFVFFFPAIVSAGVLFFLLMIYMYVMQPVKIVGQAMEPTYPNGANFLVNKFTYHDGGYQRGDVVLYHAPKKVDCPGRNCNLIHRIVGLPGDRISIHKGDVILNGTPLSESYVLDDSYTHNLGIFRTSEAVFVPDKHVLMLGDNRDDSTDSRSFGLIPIDDIIGKIGICYANCN